MRMLMGVYAMRAWSRERAGLRRSIGSIAAAGLLSLLAFRAEAAGEKDSPVASKAKLPIVLVVGRSAVLENLPIQEAKLIFLAEKQFCDGKRVIPINHKPLADTRVAFDRLVLGMTPEQVGKYWIDRKIRGQGDPPKSVHDVALLLKMVANLTGAISYVRADQLTAEVKPLRIDGKSYQDGGYPLKE
jgi:hypothetical protein